MGAQRSTRRSWYEAEHESTSHVWTWRSMKYDFSGSMWVFIRTRLNICHKADLTAGTTKAQHSLIIKFDHFDSEIEYKKF